MEMKEIITIIVREAVSMLADQWKNSRSAEPKRRKSKPAKPAKQPRPKKPTK